MASRVEIEDGRDLSDGSICVGEGVDSQVEEAEVLDGSHEPRGKLHYLRFSCHTCRMPDSRGERQFPHDVIGEQGLPGRVVVYQRLDVAA